MAEYDGLLFMEGWSGFIISLDRLEARLRADGRPVAATMLLDAYVEFRAEMTLLAETIARMGTKELRDMERETRVRPDTEGGGGERLEDNLFVEALAGTAMIPGSVGVANLDTLDKNVPWWITNEIGNTTLADRHQRLFGIFFGGDEDMPPDADAGARREHPLFAPAPPSAGGGPGVISNPIPARHFIEKAWPHIYAEWRVGEEAVKMAFRQNLHRVLATPS